MRFSIRNKITYTYAILFTIVFFILGAYLSSFFGEHYMEVLKENLINNTTLLADYVQVLNVEQLHEYSFNITDTLGLRVTVIDIYGVPIAETLKPVGELENHLNRPEIQSALQGQITTASRYSTTVNSEMLYSAAPIYNESGEVIGFFRLAKPLVEIDETLSKIRFAIIGASLIGLVLTGVFGSLISGAITSSIDKLTAKAKKFGKGVFKPVTEIHTKDEIGELEKVFNEMGHNIGKMIENSSKEKARVENILRNLPVGVLVINQNGLVETSNSAARAILGADSGGGTKPLTHLTRDYQVNDFVMNLLSGVEQDEIEIILLNSTGENQFIRFKGAGVYKNKVGQYEEIVVVLQDITDLRKLEQMRKDLVANVSHELRTPVTAIQGFAETLLDGDVDTETTDHFLGIIKTESLRLSRLITDLLNLSKLESNEKKRKEGSSNLKIVVESVVNLLKEKFESKGSSISIEVDEKINLAVDKDYVEQIIVNYLENAIKYTPVKTKITISAVPQDNGFVRIVVIDTGPGIPQRDQRRIFERFFRVEKSRQRGEGGTGLGLAIVKHIVEGFNGEVGVMSSESGTAFWATLPQKR
ncbi:HAMP domain-containing protein [Alkalicella caledoniensis]|uniref:histidine kinase n=1 Tax=Alkalicella caledoniensis TaxID=2731377 RepID=A0A7G9W4T0_ALKCA|nr:ATP-binding protein [Alkalicella caledoniensis]QNO13692.1 HAMP domain-containing protein [Alkalicella caledoniensis]